MKAKAKILFSFSIIVFDTMKLLVILAIMKLIAQINIFKRLTSGKTRLVENEDILTEVSQITERFNTFFTNMASNLKIPPYRDSGYTKNIFR